MGVQMHQGIALEGFLQLLDQGIGLEGQKQVGHVLDADVIRAHLFQLNSQIHEVILGVDGALGIAQGYLADAVVLLGGLDGGLQVAGVVQRVKDADYVDAVFDRQAHKLIHDVV